MTSAVNPALETSGFNFDNYQRNRFLEKNGLALPKAVKTGTTIVGVVYKDGVVLGADTRATEDTIVADKNCVKIHYLNKNMYCCGAGTAADTSMVTSMISSNLELHRLNTGRTVPVVVACTMLKQMLFRYQGYIGAALIVGGVDKTGNHLYSIYPHGSSDKLPYTTMGSGSLAAMAVFEANWKPDMDEKEAKELVKEGIAAGIFNDLGSGSNVDLCVIRKDSVEYCRNYECLNEKGKKQGNYKYKRGATAFLDTKVIPIHVEEEIVQMIGDSSIMDTS